MTSPLPWSVQGQSDWDRVYVVDAAGGHVATSVERDDAELIVTAVNHHAELVDACETCDLAKRAHILNAVYQADPASRARLVNWAKVKAAVAHVPGTMAEKGGA